MQVFVPAGWCPGEPFGQLEFIEHQAMEYVGAVCDRLRAHTVRPYNQSEFD